MIEIEPRRHRPRWLTFVVPVASVCAAAVVGGIILTVTGRDAFDIYGRLIERGFGGTAQLDGALTVASPLLLAGLGVAASFRMGVYNIGAQGQLVVGTIASSGVALWLTPTLGHAVIPVMILAGLVAGGLWGAIPGALRAWLNTNEVLTSLMLNYVAFHLSTYLIFGSHSYWRLATGAGERFPLGKDIPFDAEWAPITIAGVSVPQGFVLGLVAAVLVWVVYRRTKFGFGVRVIADSDRTARAVGIRTRWSTLSVMVLSGALAGLAGAANLGDSRHVLDPMGLNQSGYGYSAIVVAALARLNPLAVPLVAVLFGGLSNAGRALQGPDMPAGLVGTLQGLVLFFVVGAEFFTRYRLVRRRPGDGELAVPDTTALAELPVPTAVPALPVDDAGVSVEDAGVSVEDAGVSVEDAGVPVEDAGVSVEDAGVSVEDAAVSVDDPELPDDPELAGEPS